MCGIAGCVDPRSSDSSRIVEAQLALLDHRGPDSSGVYRGRGAAIGQTRLAVIDLLTGDPPIRNEDGSIGVVLNGEIYNFRDLRVELSAQGHKLATQGDTEVLAHLSETHEPVALARRLHGMFSYAVWDDRKRRLTLGRDRLGKKPLYYWTDGTTLVFGSEIKAVLAHPSVPRNLDPGAIPAYLTFGYVPSPRTFFEGIRSLPPGHVLVMEEGGEPRTQPYWEPRVAGVGGVTRLDMSVDQAAAELRSRLTAAIERRLVADVPLGAFLSGGVDSSTIVAIMAGLQQRPVLTFTIGFEDNEGFDERPYARTVAEIFGTEHVEFVVKPHAIDLVERLVWHHDQPFGDSSAIPTFLLSELTRRHVTVALCGDGGDELFAGYERFTGALLLDRWEPVLKGVRGPLSRALSAWPSPRGRSRVTSGRRFLDRSQMGLPDAFLAWNSFFPPERRAAFLGPDSDDWGTDDYLRIWERTAGCDVLDRLLDLNIRTYLLDDLLPKVDRMAMAHGLEVRAPFLDHELVEFALRLPRNVRVRGLSRKVVLKRMAASLLPREILRRRKQGFGVPLDRWFRTDLRSYLEGHLGAEDARIRSHLRSEPLDAMLAEHEGGTVNHGHALWALLTLEMFLRREGW